MNGDWTRADDKNSAVRADLWTGKIVLTEPRGRAWRLTVRQALALARQLHEAAILLAKENA